MERPKKVAVVRLEGAWAGGMANVGGQGEGLEGARVISSDAVEEDELIGERAEGRCGRRKRSTARAC